MFATVSEKMSCCSVSSPDWYGMLYSQADSKKKSNLMMSLFEPGPETLPWLGKISQLGPISGSLGVHFVYTEQNISEMKYSVP